MRKLTLAAALALFSTAAVASSDAPSADQGPRASGELAAGAEAGPLALRAGARAQALRPGLAMKDPTALRAGVRGQKGEAEQAAEDEAAPRAPGLRGLEGMRRIKRR